MLGGSSFYSYRLFRLHFADDERAVFLPLARSFSRSHSAWLYEAGYRVMNHRSPPTFSPSLQPLSLELDEGYLALLARQEKKPKKKEKHSTAQLKTPLFLLKTEHYCYGLELKDDNRLYFTKTSFSLR